MTYRESAAPPEQLPPELDRSILVVGLNGALVGIDRASGKYVWRYAILEGGGEVAIGLRYGLLVASASGPSIDRIDYRTGKRIWRQHTTGRGRATILVEHDCIVVAKQGDLDCLDHDGTTLWTNQGLGLGSTALGFPGNVAQADARD